MSKDPLQRYAESLQRTIEHNFNYLKEAVENFKGLCQIVTPEKRVPQDVIIDIRELYKEIRDRLTEIKAIQQVLQGKYRQYYRRDSIRDKSILEFGFLVKNLYSKVEYTLLQKQAIAHPQQSHSPKQEKRSFPSQWFHSKEHQVTLMRNLRILHELDYELPKSSETSEKREVLQGQKRHLTLFCLKGEPGVVETIHARLRLREHDLLERYSQDELHGLLTHLREVDPEEVERIFQRLIQHEEFSELRCLLMFVNNPALLESQLMERIRETLQGMEKGEVKTLKI